MKTEFQYGPWKISLVNPPIPSRCGLDWHYVHDDFDGAPDSHDHRQGHGATVEECLGEIVELQNEEIVTVRDEFKEMSNEVQALHGT